MPKPDETLRDYAIRQTMIEFGVPADIAAKVVDRTLASTGLPPDLREPEEGRVIPLHP